MLEWLNLIIIIVQLALIIILINYIKTKFDKEEENQRLNNILLRLITRKLDILEQLFKLQNLRFIPSIQAQYEPSSTMPIIHSNVNEQSNFTG